MPVWSIASNIVNPCCLSDPLEPRVRLVFPAGLRARLAVDDHHSAVKSFWPRISEEPTP